MLKYVTKDTSVTFAEFPDEIALCVNISQCPCLCDNCSESYLHEDIGDDLTFEVIDILISKYPDCTVFGFMGGDIDHGEVARLADYIHSKHNIKVGMYSGRDYIDLDLAKHLDFYKVGRWITPSKDPKDWINESCGPLTWPVSNQVYYENIDGHLVNSTYKFRRNKVNDWSRFIIRKG